MAQLHNIDFERTSFVILLVVYFQSNSLGLLDEFKRLQFGWTNTTVDLMNHCRTVDKQSIQIAFSN